MSVSRHPRDFLAAMRASVFLKYLLDFGVDYFRQLDLRFQSGEAPGAALRLARVLVASTSTFSDPCPSRKLSCRACRAQVRPEIANAATASMSHRRFNRFASSCRRQVRCRARRFALPVLMPGEQTRGATHVLPSSMPLRVIILCASIKKFLCARVGNRTDTSDFSQTYLRQSGAGRLSQGGT